MSQTDLQARLNTLHEMLGAGQFLEAMAEFLDDDVVLQEGDAEPKNGKQNAIDFEAKFLENVAEFGGYSVSSTAVAGDKTFYEAVMEYTPKDGDPVRVQQCVVDTWRNGKIVHERFYHA